MRRWSFRESDGRLISEDRVAILTPKAAAVLSMLIRNRGRIVSRDEILSEVWSGLHVKPDLVREYIFDIRAALGDDAARPTYVETVRGRGFRFLGDVGMLTGDHELPVVRPAVAVLRPEVFNSDERWRNLADALAEDVTTDLARFADLAVVARQSAFNVDRDADIRATAQALGAAYLLESSVAVEDDRLRCTFQLVRGDNGTHVWADRQVRRIAELPTLSEELAAATANAIGGWHGELFEAERRRVRRRPAAELGAYEHYLLSVHHERFWDEENVRHGIEHGRRAVSIDPGYARAWLVLYFLYVRACQLPGWDFAATHALSDAAIMHAYQLDPRDPKILCEAAYSAALEGRIEQGRSMIVRAADLGQNQADASALLALANCYLVDDLPEARRLLAAARRLNPSPPDWYVWVDCRVSFYNRDFDCCVSAARKVEGLLPPTLYGALAAGMLGDRAAAQQSREKLRQRFPDFDFERYIASVPIVAPSSVALFREAADRLCRA